MTARWRRGTRRAISALGLTVLVAGMLQAMVTPAFAAPIFSDDFGSGDFSNWTSSTRLTIDNANGSPVAPSARAQVTGQTAFAYRTLGSTYSQVCMSANVNLTAGSGVALFRLRTATNGALIRVFVTTTGTLGLRSEFAATQINSGVALGSGWHNVETCGTIGTNTTWDLYRDGVRIVSAWQASTGTTPVGRVMIGDNTAKTVTVNFDHVVLDQAVGDEGQPNDTTPPTRPGRPSGTSPSAGTIQISWAASSDASPPITYRIYRDGNATAVASTATNLFTDTGLAYGSSHTYTVDAVDAVNNVSQKSQASASITVSSPTPQPGPGHTTLVPDVPRTNVPRITSGDITDLEVIGNRVFIVGTFTSIQNNTANNTTTVNQPRLAAYNLDTGLVDTNFRPTFDRSVNEVEASPDGTKLFVVGRFNTVNGVTKRKVAAINPTTGATITGFTANANSVVESVDATNTTVYIGGDFATVNGTPRSGLAAVDATTGQVVSGFVNNLSGGIGVDGRLTVQALVLTHDQTKLLVVHTGRQINGQDRYGVGIIDTLTNQLLPWHSMIWEDNIQFIGGIQRIFAGAIAPNDEYFVVTAGSGGDRPPISDTAIAFPIDGGADVQPLWITRCFDSVYSVAISEVAVYIGGHMQWVESPTAPDPWPGLTDVGYGTGQGLSGYGLGDEVVRRDHVAALDPATGHGLEWSPGSNSQFGNQAMLVTPRGLITGGDGNLQGGRTVGRVAFYDFNTVPAPEANDSKIVNPIEGRVEQADVPFIVDGTATATSGVQRVQLEVIRRGSNQLWLQDDLTTWGPSNTINANLTSPGATSTAWSFPLTISGNRELMLRSRAVGVNGSLETSLAIKKFETFGLADATPTTNITGPSGSVIPTLTFTATGTAQDDVGVNSITYTLQDPQNRYLQDDGTVEAVYNSFRGTPDVVGATNATWSWEWTVPYEGEWTMQATAVDTAGQPDLRSSAQTWLVSANAITPTVAVTTPAVMNPPTAAAPLTMAPGSPVTFSGSATDDQALESVEISLRNTVTRENLASDGSWGTDVIADWYRISPLNLSGSSYNWSYTTPFNLRPGSYSFAVRATDNLDLTTSSTNQGRLTINVQVPGDAFPDGTLDVTGTQTGLQVLHLDLTGKATDDKGVSAVRVAIQERDSGRYIQPNGTLAAAFAQRDATLASPGATSTNWSLSVDLPTQGDYSVTAFAFDTSGQQDASTTGATARYLVYPGDTPPASVPDLFSPPEGATFTDAKIFVSGRFEDDQQMAQVQVAIRDSLGRYMSSSGNFTSTTESWRTAYLNSPGSPGSNFAYTSPAIPAGNYTVFARGVDQHGFTTNPPVQRNVIVQVPPNNPPVASFTYSCTENVCSFDGRSSTDEHAVTLTYSWSFGNGTTATGPVPTRTYTSAGSFTVTLTVKDEYAFTGSTSQTLTIVEPSGNVAPVPVINPPSCAGLTCNISSVGSADPNVGDTFTRLWNFGDGTPTSTSSAPSHAFPASGTYTVTLTVTDGWGKSASASIVVTRTEPANNVAPTPVISAPVCTGLACSFWGIGSTDPNGDAMTYLWNFGDGTPTSTSSTPSHTFPAAGTYTVTLTVTDGWGKSASTTRNVTVA